MNKALARVDPFGITPFAMNPMSAPGLFDIASDLFAPMGGMLQPLQTQVAGMERSLANMGLRQFAINVVSNDKEYIMTAELPGITKDAIKIEADEDTSTLTISANKTVVEEAPGVKEKQTQPTTTDKWLRSERRFGSVSRCVFRDYVIICTLLTL
jgi:HSP20 family molecular chaperone IbpA